jgi:hypothetical protein
MLAIVMEHFVHGTGITPRAGLHNALFMHEYCTCSQVNNIYPPVKQLHILPGSALEDMFKIIFVPIHFCPDPSPHPVPTDLLIKRRDHTVSMALHRHLVPLFVCPPLMRRSRLMIRDDLFVRDLFPLGRTD